MLRDTALDFGDQMMQRWECLVISSSRSGIESTLNSGSKQRLTLIQIKYCISYGIKIGLKVTESRVVTCLRFETEL